MFSVRCSMFPRGFMERNHRPQFQLRIPKGFRPKAQRCGGKRGATLGKPPENISNRNAVAASQLPVRFSSLGTSVLNSLTMNVATAFSLSSPNEDLSRLGSGERNSAEGEGPRGPSERERASHWAGVRSIRAHGEQAFDVQRSMFDVRCSPPGSWKEKISYFAEPPR